MPDYNIYSDEGGNLRQLSPTPYTAATAHAAIVAFSADKSPDDGLVVTAVDMASVTRHRIEAAVDYTIVDL